MTTRLIAALCLVTVLAGCAAGPAALQAGQLRYHCEHGIEFTVRFVDDTAVLDAGARGYDVLYRDAGGTTPQQSVYSNPRVRAEFGLGTGGNEAVLNYPALPLAARCARS